MDGSPPRGSSNVHMSTHTVAHKLVRLCRRLLASPNQEMEDVLFQSIVIDVSLNLPLCHPSACHSHHTMGQATAEDGTLTWYPGARSTENSSCLPHAQGKEESLSSPRACIFFLVVCFEFISVSFQLNLAKRLGLQADYLGLNGSSYFPARSFWFLVTVSTNGSTVLHDQSLPLEWPHCTGPQLFLWFFDDCFGAASLDTWWLLKCLLYEWRETQRISDSLE